MHRQSKEVPAAVSEPERTEVWVAMAEHFLDTETRPDIPRTALCCVEARLSIADARQIWQYEVTPAVGHNLWSVAGQWVNWDRAWLVERIEQVRKSDRPKYGIARYLGYRLLVGANHGVWSSIARCMDLLWSLSSVAQRQQATADLGLLSAYSFDFGPRPGAALDPERVVRLRALHTGPFLQVLQPALLRGEAAAVAQRLRLALHAGP